MAEINPESLIKRKEVLAEHQKVLIEIQNADNAKQRPEAGRPLDDPSADMLPDVKRIVVEGKVIIVSS